MTPASPARRVAARVLERVAVDAAFADLALEAELSRHELSSRDRSLATEMVYGTLRWQRYLDWLLSSRSRRPLERVDTRVLVLLRMTAYQILFLERVPTFAAVNDAVTLARETAEPGAHGFVNAVLRAFARSPRQEPTPPADPLEVLALRSSFPTWLAGRWADRYGLEEAAALMGAMNERPPLTIRVNTLRESRQSLTDRLAAEEGLRATPTRYAPEGLEVEHGGTPGAWRSFGEGAFVVQDEGSILVTRLLEPEPGEAVADVCAAPGTKSTHLAQLMENRGRVAAFDTNPTRLARLDEAAPRLGLTIVEWLPATTEAAAERFPAAFDRVLVDAPCSNLGVLRRNPEVKWRRAPRDIALAAALQRSILAAAGRMVKPGGRIVYATCSLEPEENEDVVRAFLAERRDFGIDLPAAFPLPLDADGSLRCLPHRHGTDGFTAFRLRRAL